MYLKIFCFVSVLVAVYASNFDEELPLYLSDDILISNFPIIAKRSLSKTDQIDSEKLPERHTTNDGKIADHTESIRKVVKRDTTPKEKGSAEQKKEKTDGREIETKEESGLVFLPSFGRRTRRSIVKKEDKDLLNSESNIVFLPSFKRKGFRRFRRDVDGGNYRHYVKRSADNDKVKNKDSSATEQNEELSDSDTVNGQESGLVFLPSFGRRSRRNIDETSYPAQTKHKTIEVTSISSGDNKQDQVSIKPLIPHKNTKREVKSETTEHKEPKQYSSDGDANDESGEESGLVFLPSFGRRSRRSLNTELKAATISPIDKKHDQQPQIKAVPEKKTKREVKNETTEKNKKKLSDSDEDTNDESGEESGLVFLPSFGRRSRRSLNAEQKAATISPIDKKHDQQPLIKAVPEKKTKREVKNETTERNKEKLSDSNEDTSDESGEESGLVFLPSFGRRSRRSLNTELKAATISPIDKKHDQQPQIKAVPEKKTKREVKNETTEKNKKKLSDSDEDTNDESGEESGLVFLPSFGRRSRRSVAEHSTSTDDGKHDREQITKRPILAENEKTGVPNLNSEQKKTDVAVGNEHDESREESGLVFLPSFGRRHRRDTSSSTSSTTRKEVSTVSTVRKE